MFKTSESRVALAVAVAAVISCLWFGLTLFFTSGNPLNPPGIISLVALSGFVVLCAVLIARLSSGQIRRTRRVIHALSGPGLHGRLYVTNVETEPGKIQLELNALMDRVEDTMARQRQFVGAISHDIRTPLTIIKGDIEVSLARERSPEEYRDVLLSNLEEVERIQLLVEDLVTLARVDYGELGLNVRAFSLSSLVAEAREGFTEAGKRKGLILESYVESEVNLSGDEARLRQLLHNLLENALHYTPSGGRVELTMLTDVERDEIQIRVRDTGIGISSRDLPHIFEPFYRGTPSRRTRHNGYGLGLAICDHIVRAHGGKISVESREGPGSGTTFTVHLPRRPAGPPV